MTSVNLKAPYFPAALRISGRLAGFRRLVPTLAQKAVVNRWWKWPAGKTDEKSLVLEIRRLRHLLKVEEQSDLQLREAIQQIKRKVEDGSADHHWIDHVGPVFAIVDECIRRRLGIWRLFKDPASRRSYSRCLEAVEAEGGVDGLDDAERVIADAIKQVDAAGYGRFGPVVQLPAAFYRAAREKDTDNLLRFHPTDEQLLAGIYLLQGKAVEMQAGEGKTIAIAFAAVMQAVLGRPVHIMTANDYLADRDWRLLTPVYHALGIAAAAVQEPMEKAERKVAYGCDLVYGTLREFGFDYLRNNLVNDPGEQIPVRRQVAIVDEADQALIDEADTPLIIAGPSSEISYSWSRVNGFVAELVEGQEKVVEGYTQRLKEAPPDSASFGLFLCLGLLTQPRHQELRRLALRHPRSYRRGLAAVYPDGNDEPDEELVSDLYCLVDTQSRFVTLTAKGIAFLESRLGDFFSATNWEAADSSNNSIISRKTARKLNLANQVYQCLRAHLLLGKGVDYLVTDDSVVLLDPYTGRLKPDNSYQDGLQSALEAKEGVSFDSASESLAQVSVRGFAAQYELLSGITGTAQTAAGEFQRRYFLETVSVPTSNSLQRVDLPSRIFSGEEEKMDSLVKEVTGCQELGRPVLVGVQSVEQSLRVSRALSEAGVEHRILNAVRSDEEADIIRGAGKFGAVTVATNMAGRGTDVILEPELDRQLAARCAELALNKLANGSEEVFVHCPTREERVFLQGIFPAGCGVRLTGPNIGSKFTLTVLDEGSGRSGREASGDVPSIKFGLGLHLISAEFNRFPRVALQLKGRSGRQGHFGSTRALLSWEDQWLLPLGKKAPGLKGRRKVGRAGPAYFEGECVERYVRDRQRDAEREAATRRSVTSDYAAIMDGHTAAYYQARQQILEGTDLGGEVGNMVWGTAARLVEAFFPQMDPNNYTDQFAAFAREIAAQLAIDVADLRGTPLDQLAVKLAEKVIHAADLKQALLGEGRYGKLVRQLLLECSDEAWQAHRQILRRTIFSSTANGYDHKSAVADYIIHSAERWDRFQERVADAFLASLLTFPLEILEETAAGKPELTQLDRELELIMG